MRKALAIATGFLIIAAPYGHAQEKTKPDAPKAKSVHETMTRTGGGAGQDRRDIS